VRLPGGAHTDWILAALAFTSVLACAIALHQHASDVDDATACRHRKLQQLAAWTEHGAAHAADLGALEGVFPGYEIVEETAEWGGYLALRDRRAEAGR
jgi:hypothetical protein